MSSVQLSVSVATVGLMPLLFIPSLRHLSHFSSLGVVSCLVVVAAVVAATVIDPHRKASFIQVGAPRNVCEALLNPPTVRCKLVCVMIVLSCWGAALANAAGTGPCGFPEAVASGCWHICRVTVGP
jgi:hypothetical protein